MTPGEIDARIAELLALPDDWDGEGSPPTNPKAAENARSIAKMLARVGVPAENMHIIAFDGGIDIEIYANGIEIDVQCSDRGSIAIRGYEVSPRSMLLHGSVELGSAIKENA